VISPEGCASILWKSADKKEVAAEALNLTASTALLAALATLRVRHRLVLRALHVNHHLQPAAAAMARAARASARRLGVPCQVLDAPVRLKRGESPEAAARAVRYERAARAAAFAGSGCCWPSTRMTRWRRCYCSCCAARAWLDWQPALSGPASCCARCCR
jgi:hypothetical protein